jgi:hypothetical protein|tara:strand:+ start:1975 stop:2316 length:342 start_codon:yes stop_codon:yes gene_type:complete
MEIKKQQLIIENTTQNEFLHNLVELISQQKEQRKLIKKVLYIPDVAKQLNKSNTHVRRLVRLRKIKFLQEKPGTEIIFYQEFIDEYLDSLVTISKKAQDQEIQSFINNPLSHE